MLFCEAALKQWVLWELYTNKYDWSWHRCVPWCSSNWTKIFCHRSLFWFQLLLYFVSDMNAWRRNNGSSHKHKTMNETQWSCAWHDTRTLCAGRSAGVAVGGASPVDAPITCEGCGVDHGIGLFPGQRASNRWAPPPQDPPHRRHPSQSLRWDDDLLYLIKCNCYC